MKTLKFLLAVLSSALLFACEPTGEDLIKPIGEDLINNDVYGKWSASILDTRSVWLELDATNCEFISKDSIEIWLNKGLYSNSSVSGKMRFKYFFDEEANLILSNYNHIAEKNISKVYTRNEDIEYGMWCEVTEAEVDANFIGKWNYSHREGDMPIETTFYETSIEIVENTKISLLADHGVPKSEYEILIYREFMVPFVVTVRDKEGNVLQNRALLEPDNADSEKENDYTFLAIKPNFHEEIYLERPINVVIDSSSQLKISYIVGNGGAAVSYFKRVE